MVLVQAGTEMRNCPFCGGEILPKALHCRHCRRWMPEALRAPAPAPAPPPAYSDGQHPVHLVLLSVSTLGLYEVYWFWRNWRDLRDKAGMDLSPAWRTVGLFLPVVNVAMVYHQLRLVSDTAASRGLTPTYSPLAVTMAFFALALAGNLTLLWMVSLLNVLPLVPVQQTLNRLWQLEHPDAPLRERFAPHELAAMVAGAAATAAALLATAG
jgi:hypothetical protein